MLKWLFLFIGAAHAQAVGSPHYLIFVDQPTCLARSKAQCQALGCDGVNTIYWWSCNTGPLKAGLVGPTAVITGSFALSVDTIGQFSPTATSLSATVPTGLTAQEQTSLVSSSALAPLLPPPNAVP